MSWVFFAAVFSVEILRFILLGICSIFKILFTGRNVLRFRG